MKKVGIILLLVGIGLFVIGGVWFFISQLFIENSYDLSEIFDSNLLYYRIDDKSFSIMNFVEDDSRYIVQIRKKTIVDSNNSYDGNYSSLQYPIEISFGKIVSKKGNFSLNYQDMKLEFTSDDASLNKDFGGYYTKESEDYLVPQIISDNYLGLYQKKDDYQNIIYVNKKDNDYYISGFINSHDTMEDIEFKEKISLEDKMVLLNNNIHITFDNKKIILVSQNNQKKWSFANGEYDKITQLSKQTIYLELNKYVMLLPKSYGVIH